MTSRPKIVVGIDGSSRGDDALAFAAELARTVGTGLLLVHAHAPGETRAQANAILEARRADVPVEIVAYADPSPARALHRVAAARRASLIVVGPSHRAGLGLVLPGSTAQQLLADGIRAVAVVPTGWRPRPDAGLRRIGCGYDGSLQADAALETAAGLSRAFEGRLDVMRAFWSAPLSGAQEIAAAADLEARARAGLGEAMESLPDDIDAHARVLLNDPARALVVASRDLDLLVLGARGFGPIGAIWAGSVSSRVMREASCPVIVVPRRVLPTLTEPATAASA